MRYEYYDRNKDFQKEPYDSLPKHNIYALSDEILIIIQNLHFKIH